MPDERTPLLDHCQERTTPAQDEFYPFGHEDEQISLVSIRHLFRFCDRTDAILLPLAIIGSFLYGIVTPAQFLLFGKMVDDFVEYIIYQRSDVPNLPDLEESTTRMAVWYVAIAICNFLFAWMGMGLFALSAERQVHKIRSALFRNVIYQEIGWFDFHSSGELYTRFTDDINRIGDGVGSNFGRIISSVVSFVAAFVIGFVLVADLTLILLAIFPVIMLVGWVMAKVTGNYSARELRAYSKAGKVAEQSISSIRTVAAFGGEEKQSKLYDERISEACKFGIKKGIFIGLGMGLFQLVLYSDYALSVWYIINLARETKETPGQAIAVFFAITMASMIVGQVGSCFQALAVARGAAFTVFSFIDRESKINASSNAGLKPVTVKGDLTFSHVDFAYPTRSSFKVLNDFSFNVPSGRRVVLVGKSGCGKSTIVKLLQRFYDPAAGSILLDGRDIKSLNVRHLRSLIGVVNQEPVLFATTIAENIAYGREGVTQKHIEVAAKMANAHDFIINFPQGYNTLCGERGAKMSGGQRQRIAIARALIRDPKILLLDEATSALDNESEVAVREALDRLLEDRTTIIIAHRLSTIRNADIIVVINDGRVTEKGTHDKLIAINGLYSSLVKLQVGYEDDPEEENVIKGQETFGICEDISIKVTSLATSVSNLDQARELHQLNGDDAPGKPVSFIKILKLNSPEWKYLMVGCFGAGLYGIFPFLYSLAFGGILHTMRYNPNIQTENEKMKDESINWSVFYFIIGVESGLGIFLQNWCFAEAGEALTKRLRKKAFLAFLRQDMAYFDKPNHNTGAICRRLDEEVSSIQGATGPQLGLAVSALITIIGGLVVAFTACWQLTLIMIAFIPFLIIAGMFMNYILGNGDVSVTTSDAGYVVEETFSIIHTIVSLGREKDFLERYTEATMLAHRKAKKIAHVVGVATGTFMGILNLSFAVAFRFGGYLVTEGDVTLRDMMTSIFTVILSAIIVGQVVSITPNYAKAKNAATRMFALLDKVPGIDSNSDKGKRPMECYGKINFTNVRFRYPTRNYVEVLRNLNLTVKPGQTVALVGTNGCGKSTSVSLVERFYDINSGSLTIDGYDIREFDLRWLRSQIGIVSQEPVLFDVSIRDNIAYGDNTRRVSDKEVEEAAKSAHIHEFISTLPQGYDTVVGDKGTLISGGQKQRIAIARALIRDPKILLLDEATSALDTESERNVQEALDKAGIGRTTLVITHRLSTVQNADAIMVIKRGKVVERGTHQQLLALKGIYYALHKANTKS